MVEVAAAALFDEALPLAEAVRQRQRMQVLDSSLGTFQATGRRTIKQFGAPWIGMDIVDDSMQPIVPEDTVASTGGLVLDQDGVDGNDVRLYTFLSQIFDYGNTEIEKRAIFFKRLLPLLEFGREREGVDLSKVVLTRHNLKNQGKHPIYLTPGDAPTLAPITGSGSGSVQVKEKVLLAAIIEKLNELFGSETTDQDQLVYVNGVIMGKMLESETLRKQAANNSKEQFATSPDLGTELDNAIIEALDAHTLMSTKALNSPEVKKGIMKVLLEHSGLWEKLREAG